VPVEIKPVFPDGTPLASVHFYVKAAGDDSCALTNRTPSQGALHIAVRPGPVTVRTRSAACEDAEASVDAVAEGVVLEIPLRRRAEANGR